MWGDSGKDTPRTVPQQLAAVNLRPRNRAKRRRWLQDEERLLNTYEPVRVWFACGPCKRWFKANRITARLIHRLVCIRCGRKMFAFYQTRPNAGFPWRSVERNLSELDASRGDWVRPQSTRRELWEEKPEWFKPSVLRRKRAEKEEALTAAKQARKDAWRAKPKWMWHHANKPRKRKRPRGVTSGGSRPSPRVAPKP